MVRIGMVGMVSHGRLGKQWLGEGRLDTAGAILRIEMETTNE